MSDFMAYLFAIFVVNPLQADISERLQGVAAADLIQSGHACVSAEVPRLLQMAKDNWSWAASHAIGVSVGLVDPVSLLSANNEHCGRIIGMLDGERTEAEG